jgi:hypothetical protein
LPAIGTALGVAAIGYGCYQLAVYASNQIDVDDQLETGIKEQHESLRVDGKKKPSIRTEPTNLEEQLALEDAKTKPSRKEDEIMKDKIKDPNYPKEDWAKKAHVHEKPDGTNIDIHYWENRFTGERKDFKFKNYE